MVLILILTMVAVGGVTRLTDSGLSMVTWEPILGSIPPLSEADWQYRFDQYREHAEYKMLRGDMALSEFKRIFFWEYFHRLLGRVLGLVYVAPLVVFWMRSYLSAALKGRLVFGLVLGASQGLMGWWMVKSGLADDPYVSHYRLAAHLGMAFGLFAYLIWIYLSLSPKVAAAVNPASPKARCWLTGLLALLVLQIVWGAFVAGLNAGFTYNTFPKMMGHWIPPSWNQLSPAWLNFVSHPVGVQFVHRILGVLLLLYALVAWVALRRDPTVAGDRCTALSWFVVLLSAQFCLGVLTLVSRVPLVLGVIHQVFACLLVGLASGLWFLFGDMRGGAHAAHRQD